MLVRPQLASSVEREWSRASIDALQYVEHVVAPSLGSGVAAERFARDLRATKSPDARLGERTRISAGRSVTRLPVRAYTLGRAMRVMDGSRQRLNQVVVILASFSKGAEHPEARLFIRAARTRIRCRSRHAYRRPPRGAEPVEQQRQRLWADPPTEKIRLADEDVHVNQISRQVAEPGCRELLGKRALPTEVADRASVDGDQRMVRGRMLADGSQGLIPAPPPAAHMRATEPDPKQREVAR
jgi:hypothetical protein